MLFQAECQMKISGILITVSICLFSVAASAATAAGAPPQLQTAVDSAALAMGDEYDQALEYLKSRPDLFEAGAAAVTKVVAKYSNDADVARRLLDLATAYGSVGCTFAATLVARPYPAWVSGVLKRYPDTMRCSAMDKAVAGILKWVPDPDSSRDAENLVIETMASLKMAFNIEGAEAACAFVDRGSIVVRTGAASLISTVRPEKGLTCLVKAYDREKGKEEKALADVLLEAIARFGGANSYPHLLNALETPGQFELACRVMAESGDDALITMIKAARAFSGKSGKLMNCLSIYGSQAQIHVLPLLRDKSREIRNFALDFFSRNQSLTALTVLKSGFINGENSKDSLGIPREQILDALSSYPVEEIKDVVELALTDNDDRIRERALDLIRSRKSLVFSGAVRTVAETDPNRSSRAAALGILWLLGDFGAEPLLRRMAQYEEATIAAEAVRILGYIGTQDSVQVLRKIATGSSGQVKGVEAMKALALLGMTSQPLDAAYTPIPAPKTYKSSGIVSCGAFRAAGLGTKGPLLLALPGGPGMDSSWARPWMDELSRNAIVAYVEPTGVSGDEKVVLTPQEFDCFVEGFHSDKVVLVSDGLGGTAAHWLAFQVPYRIAGVITISAPLPGNLTSLEASRIRSLPLPFGDIAADLFKQIDLFRTEAIDLYMRRALAPSMAGNMKDVRRALQINFSSRRLQTASQELSKPEVRFVPLEVNKPVLWFLPESLMDQEALAGFKEVASQKPGMFRISSTDKDCGFMPQISCSKYVLKQMRSFISDL